MHSRGPGRRPLRSTHSFHVSALCYTSCCGRSTLSHCFACENFTWCGLAYPQHHFSRLPAPQDHRARAKRAAHCTSPSLEVQLHRCVRCCSPSWWRWLTPLSGCVVPASGKFVSIRGNVIRVSSVRPLVIKMNFTCAKCTEVLVVGCVTPLFFLACQVAALEPLWRACRFPDGKYEPPLRCPTKGCRCATFSDALPSRSAVVCRNRCSHSSPQEQEFHSRARLCGVCGLAKDQNPGTGSRP